MKPITFCIASANNEREYTKLLLKSLQDHTEIANHEILIFVDSDNQNTYEALVDIKATLPNLKICKNPNDFPIGSQRNVSVMFNAASNDIVCYLQSDMVVGKDFDKHIISSLTSEKVFVCSTRVEPPIHPPSNDKYTQNFGLDVTNFNYNEFNSFVDKMQQYPKQDTDDYSVPFALYKKTWLNVIKGYDTQFRCSHEDIDSVVRLHLAGINIKQNWKAIVYHFTCVSSRGADWFKNNTESNYKKEIQQLASHEEAKRYLRKWGTSERNVHYRYKVGLSLNVDRYVDINFIKQIEPYFDIIQFKSDPSIVNQLISQLSFEAHYYSNIRWGYPSDYWEQVKHLFNPTNFKLRITNNPIDLDVLVTCNYSDLILNNQQSLKLASTIQHIIHENPPGIYESDCYQIEIRQKHNYIGDLVGCSNLQVLLDTKNIKFI